MINIKFINATNVELIKHGNPYQITYTLNNNEFTCNDNFFSKDNSNCYYFKLSANSNNVQVSGIIDSVSTSGQYSNLFNNCSQIKKADKLILSPTTLVDGCYRGMFYGCSSLIAPPTLPATNLAPSCYMYMFQKCYSLTSAPDLPATSLANCCYSRMFSSCSGLSNVNVSFANWNASISATFNWLSGVAASGTFKGPIDLDMTTNDISHVPSGWTVNKYIPKNRPYFTVLSRGKYPLWFRIDVDGEPSYPQTIYYRINGTGSWQQYSFYQGVGDSLQIPIGDYVELSGTGSGWSDNSTNVRYFVATNGQMDVGGNILSLVNMNETLSRGEFTYLFYKNSLLIDASNLKLPSTTSQNCYRYMFAGCSNLTAAPALPATSLVSTCYYHMFQDCTSLSTAPQLPATEFQQGCYWSMFSGCTSLTAAPVLSATTLAPNCYNYMFYGCSNLKYVTAYFRSWGQTSNWLSGVKNAGTFTKYKSLPQERGPSYIPSSWFTVNIKEPYFPVPIKFTSTGNTKIALNKLGEPNISTIRYSKNGGAWTDYTFGQSVVSTFGDGRQITFTPGEEISLANNNYVELSGNGKFSKNTKNRYQFSTSGQGTLSLSGTVHGFTSGQYIEDDYEYNSLFQDCKNIVDATQLQLPQNTTKWCYANMFLGCTNLTGAPVLTAASLADWCYSSMFAMCYNLSSTPTLKVEILKPHCYSNMFQSCINLQNPTNLSSQAVSNWSYNAMFEGCIKVNAAEQWWLPDETLTSGCYSSMYRFCSTTDAPYLPSESFAKYCYDFMFDRSTVSSVQVEFEQWPSDIATSCWLRDVSPTGTFICPSALPTSIQYRTSNPSTSFPLTWDVWNYQTMPLTFRTKEYCRIELVKVGSPNTVTLYYSKDYGKNWTRFYPNTPISLFGGEHVSFSGTTEHFSKKDLGTLDTADFYRFSTSGTTSLRVYGNIMSLVNNQTTITDNSQFAYLFAGCSGISDARRLNLPATTLAENCFLAMFSGCTNLSRGLKVLPATTLPGYAYHWMFASCTSLSIAPHIKATTLGQASLQNMFRGCTNLQEINVDFTSWYGGGEIATYNWVLGVDSELVGTFYKPTNLTEQFGDSYIPTDWQVEDK